MTQWHPIFAHLLRSTLRDYYEVQTNVPVGDLPREADIIVLRRATGAKPPFRTLWKHLTRWNILEFKGRSESARVADIDLLAEVGLGIHRRLQEKAPDVKVPRADVSFWYLANHLGKRFLRDVIELTGELEAVGPGLWRGRISGRPVWLVSNSDVPIDAESASVSAVSDQSIERAFELAKVALASDVLWQTYGPLLATLYPDQWKEFDAMARKQKKGEIDVKAVWEKVFDPAAKDRFLDYIVETISPKKRDELLRRLQAEMHKKKPTATT